MKIYLLLSRQRNIGKILKKSNNQRHINSTMFRLLTSDCPCGMALCLVAPNDLVYFDPHQGDAHSRSMRCSKTV